MISNLFNNTHLQNNIYVNGAQQLGFTPNETELDQAFEAYAEALRAAGHAGTTPTGDERDRIGASWGSERGVLSEVEVHGPDPSPDHLEPGDPTTIAFTVGADDPVPFPVLGVSVATEDGPTIENTGASTMSASRSRSACSRNRSGVMNFGW